MADQTPEQVLEATRSKPKGKALRWSKARIDELASVEEEDLESARQNWHQKAPTGFPDLIDAKGEDG